MGSADTSLGFTGIAAAVLRELRSERAAGADARSPDRFVSSGVGSTFFSRHLRPLLEVSPATRGEAASEALAESARGLQREPQTP